MNATPAPNDWTELFSIAYAAMNISARGTLHGVRFSIAYAAMNAYALFVRLALAFSIAYAAMNRPGTCARHQQASQSPTRR